MLRHDPVSVSAGIFQGKALPVSVARPGYHRRAAVSGGALVNSDAPASAAHLAVNPVGAVEILYQLPVLVGAAVILVLLHLGTVRVYGALYLQIFSRQSIADPVIAAVFYFRHMAAAINIRFRGQSMALIGKLVTDSVGISGVCQILLVVIMVSKVASAYVHHLF